MVKNDSDSTRRIAAFLTQIQRLSEEINGLLHKLCSGPIDDDRIKQMQVLHGVAVACGNSWIGRNLLAIYYSTYSKMLPNGYYTEPLNPGVRAKYTITVMESQLVMPPASYTLALQFQGEGKSEVKSEAAGGAAEVEEAEETQILAELEGLEIEEELESENLATTIEQVETLEAEVGEAEAEEMLELEALEAEGALEIEQIGVLEFGVVAAAEILLPAVIIAGFGVYELVSAIKEIENGSKVANTIADVANQLSKYTEVASTVYTKLKNDTKDQNRDARKTRRRNVT